MTKLYVVLGACALLLAGCMSNKSTRTLHHYTLGSPTSAVTGAHPVRNDEQRTLKIARFIVPTWLAGTDMYYRLSYRDDGRLAPYGYSDWAAPPATLLEPQVQHVLAAGGGWRAVLGPHNPAKADVSLHVRIDDFSQAFASANQSAGVIDATATIMDNSDSNVIAQKHFHIEVPASSADAQGGAKALSQASRKFAQQLQRWLRANSLHQRD